MIYVNVRPLLEANFTGIPQLTWHVTRFWLERPAESVRFFVGTMEISRDVIKSLVQQRTGRYWAAIRHQHREAFSPISIEDARKSVALFPHSREMREKMFGREVQIIHDLTAIITPEFHPRELAAWEARRMLRDAPQIDCFVCVSEATRLDLISYFDIEPSRAEVAYPGVAWFPEHKGIYRLLAQTEFDKYALVLGTFEPRKNVELVFNYLLSNPNILDDYTFCFCGSRGWGGIYDRCLQNPRIASFIQNGRIRIMPFVNERLKFALMKEASFLIYPSFIEGFGSPVAEAMSLGVPVALSYGGSLPEVAGDAGYYFDPVSLQSLSGAVSRVVDDLTRDNAATRLAAMHQGAKFTWSAFNRIVDNVVSRLALGA